MDYPVLLFYKYISIADPAALQAEQLVLCQRLGLKGRLLLGYEGVNGTLAGPRAATDEYIAAMREDVRFSDIDFKISPGTPDVFPRLSVKVRDEIVTLGATEGPDLERRGRSLKPREFHALIQREDVVVLDARNAYESAIGRFKGALTPNISTFKQFPSALAAYKDKIKDKPVAMYCTGGIRCEKASALLREAGVDEVYQLEGGIHRYLEEFPDGEWEGELFVFDGRMKLAFRDDPEQLGSCTFCKGATNEYTNCANKPCNQLILVCESCAPNQTTCSRACSSALTLA